MLQSPEYDLRLSVSTGFDIWDFRSRHCQYIIAPKIIQHRANKPPFPVKFGFPHTNIAKTVKVQVDLKVKETFFHTAFRLRNKNN